LKNAASTSTYYSTRSYYLQNIENCFTLLRICHQKFEDGTLCPLSPWGVKRQFMDVVHTKGELKDNCVHATKNGTIVKLNCEHEGELESYHLPQDELISMLQKLRKVSQALSTTTCNL